MSLPKALGRLRRSTENRHKDGTRQVEQGHEQKVKKGRLLTGSSPEEGMRQAAARRKGRSFVPGIQTYLS